MSVTPSQFPTLPQADIDGTETFWVQKDGVDYKVGHAYLFPAKKYIALITQSGTNAPTVDILENTIGNIVWTRSGVGVYSGTLVGAFTTDKTTVLHKSVPGDDTDYLWLSTNINEDAIDMNTYLAAVASDNIITFKDVIEITVYH